MRVKNPLTDREAPIQQVLNDLAAQENCDGEPYDQCIQAAEYINTLEHQLRLANNVIDKVIPSDMNQRQLIASYKKFSQPEQLTLDDYQEQIEEWHTTYQGSKSLQAFLGLSFEQYYKLVSSKAASPDSQRLDTKKPA